MSTEPGKEAFITLIKENRGIIFKICNSYCPNINNREDLAQEIIFQLWKSFGSFNAEYKFSTWMYRIALNVAITFYRKESRASKTITLRETLPDIEDKLHGTHETAENINLLQQFINELKELDKALMILYLEEKNHKEIAEILGITETNVATKLSRIKDKLKQKFSTIHNL
ncbi:MAG: sigma-70 family RNA polymerase sigma factor [Ferruginibacter sp.]